MTRWTRAGVNRHTIVVFGPSLDALSGVSTHVRMLLASDLPRDFEEPPRRILPRAWPGR